MKPLLLPSLKVRRNALRLGSLALKCLIFLPFPAFCQSKAVSFATIPFAFTANGKALPAGDYVLYRDNDSIYSLRTRRGVLATRIMLYHDTASAPPAESRYTFRKERSGYVFESFWTSGSRDGMRVLNSRHKNTEIAASGNEPATVMVASSDHATFSK